MSTYKRRTYRKKRYNKRRNSSYVRNVAKYEAKKAINSLAEHKNTDLSVGSTNIDFSGFVSSMTYNLQQGVGNQSYVGQAIKPTYLSLRYVISAVSLGTENNVVRVILLQSKGGDLPTPATILAGSGTVQAPLSPYNKSYSGRYKVLRDKVYSLSNVTRTVVNGKIKIPGKYLRQVQFRDGVGTLESGGLYLHVISDSGAANHPTITFYSRLSYVDL